LLDTFIAAADETAMKLTEKYGDGWSKPALAKA